MRLLDAQRRAGLLEMEAMEVMAIVDDQQGIGGVPRFGPVWQKVIASEIAQNRSGADTRLLA